MNPHQPLETIRKIETLLGISLQAVPTDLKRPLRAVAVTKKDTPKYLLDPKGEKLIGLNLADLGLTDTQWKEVLPLLVPDDLQALSLCDNQITEFRAEWGFQNLEWLNLYDNPLSFPPEEIVAGGHKAILNYLKELGKGDVVVYEAKLLILGEAGAGKTTLARKLKDTDAPMPEVEETTTGIEVNRWLTQQPGKPDFTAHLWDFGGQVIYHSTHQFFLSKRSLYVLVLDGRLEEDPHYWLKVQDLLGEESPVIILLNKKGEARESLAFHELQGLYPNLVKPHEVFSLKDEPDALDSFRQKVLGQIRDLPHIRKNEKVPRIWAEVRTRLETIAQTKDYIPLEQYREICEEVGLKEPERQDFLSDFLHSLGVILHFSKEPGLKKMVILQPTWATNAVYKILDHTREPEQMPGHLTQADLNRIWSDPRYRDATDELVTLMEKFELCYPLPGKRGEYIFPQLLSQDKPAYSWSKADQLQYHYVYGFMPKGIVTRLIVRLQRYIQHQDTVWRRGAVFAYVGAEAEVIEDYQERRIEIKTTGTNRKDFLSIITHEINGINSAFDFDERTKVSELIPCNCSGCNAEENPYFFTKEVLQNAKAKGVETLQCQKSFGNIPIGGLFENVFPPGPMRDRPDESKKEKTWHQTYIEVHGNIGNLNLDQRSLSSYVPPMQRLVEAQWEAQLITKDDYDELMDILEDIKETEKPNDRQKKRWKRWLGKAADAGRKFVGKRIEKGADTAVGEGVKEWVEGGGLDSMMNLLG
ncbi:MAG: COR domain-containing protein [Bacteroidota bacterium]